MPDPPPPSVVVARMRTVFKSGLVLAGLGALLWGASRIDLEPAFTRIDALGPWGPVAYCALYAVSAAALVPGSLLTLAAGAKWGPVVGTIYAVVAANLGANLAFGLGRFVAREWVSRTASRRPVFAAIDDAVGREGWKIVGLLRLSPVLPYTLLNYALGITRVKWRDYALASLIGMLPGTAMYVYLGSVYKLAGRAGDRTPGEKILFGVGLAATVAATLYITRVAKTALRQKLGPPPPP